MFETIAVPLDTSRFAERALAPATELARAADASLLLLSASSLEADVSYLRATERELGTSVAVRSTVFEDCSAADAIAQVAASPDTLVCLASHGRSGPARLVLGSVTSAVLARVTAPVMVVGPRYATGVDITGGDLVLPIDGSSLAAEAVPTALAFAKAFDMRIWVVNVVQRSSPEVDHGPSDVQDTGLVERIAEELGHEHDRTEGKVLHGHPAGRLVELADSLPAALVVMTTHGRTGLRGATTGSVAMHLVHEAGCPVLVARPAIRS